MNETEKPGITASSARRRMALTIRRDDHIGDRIGTIFLDPDSEGEQGIIQLVRDYLGRGIRVMKVELSRDRVEVEVESTGWVEESKRLTAAAEDLHLKGGRRGSQAMLEEALKLDALNHNALKRLGMLLADRGEHEEAFRILKRAREIGGDSVPALLAMGKVCMQLDRVPSAVEYLQLVIKAEPKNQEALAALESLGRAPEPVTYGAAKVRLIRGGKA
jgi:tetratricopeptide (TPR) repeat protein